MMRTVHFIFLIFLILGVTSYKTKVRKRILANSSYGMKPFISGTKNLTLQKVHDPPVKHLSSQCKEDMMDYFSAVMLGNLTNNNWALQMMDSLGKGVQSGSLHQFWLEGGGDFEECMTAQHPTRGFSGKHCALSIIPKNPIYPGIHPFISLCLPSTCSEKELQGLFYTDLETSFKVPFELVIEDRACHSRETTKTDSRFPLAILLWVILFSALFVCTVEHLRLLNEGKGEEVSKLIGIFSVVKGVQSFFASETTKNDIKVIHGLRIFGVIFVLRGHILSAMSAGPFRNVRDYVESYLTYRAFPENLFQVVEVFFVISWFLLSLDACKDIALGTPKSQILRKLLGRMTRFQSILAFHLYALVPLLPLVFKGSHASRVSKHFSYSCAGEEWVHLTFTASFFEDTTKLQCQGHLWQFSTEMQLTMLIPLIVAMLVKFPFMGWFLLGVGSLASVGYKGYSAYHYEYMPEVFPCWPVQLKHYKQSYNRVFTLTVALFFGLNLFKNLYILKKKTIPKKLLQYGWAAWIIAALVQICLNCSYISFHKVAPHPSNLFISHLLVYEKIVTPILVGWIIYVSAHGHGGFIEKLFYWNFFRYLSKLSIGVYILHFSTQHILFTNYFAPYDITWKFANRRFFPQMLIHFAAAFLFHIFIENPLGQAASYLLEKIWPRKRDSKFI